jgi:hypothetical protein
VVFSVPGKCRDSILRPYETTDVYSILPQTVKQELDTAGGIKNLCSVVFLAHTLLILIKCGLH